MKYYVIKADNMTSEHYKQWLLIQEKYEYLANPYFHPEFTRAVAHVRTDVYVGIIEDNGVIVGFFPFHRSRSGRARPLGLALSDYHGVVAPPDLKFSVADLMSSCKLTRWDFDHLISAQEPFLDYHEELFNSPIIQVSEGFESFKAQLNASGRKQLKEAERKNQKLEEEIGPVRFTKHSSEKAILNTLMQWKSEQCQRTGTVDYFSIEWCVRLIEYLHSNRSDNFGGMLSCLYAGKTLAAVHFSLYSSSVWHSWFPSYNHELESYSPGSILLYKMIEEAAKNRVQYIDLGKGMSLYKKRVMTGSISIADGCVIMPSFSNKLAGIKNSIEFWAKGSLFKPVLRIPGKIIKNIEREKRYK